MPKITQKSWRILLIVGILAVCGVIIWAVIAADRPPKLSRVPKTYDNLVTALIGENTANKKYLLYAEKAESEGNTQAALLFRAIAAGERVHIEREYKLANDVAPLEMPPSGSVIIGDTEENLEDCIKNENYETALMYPQFARTAETEDYPTAADAFGEIGKAEAVHEQLYREMLTKLEKTGSATDAVVYFVCPVCGNVYEGAPPDRCPICDTPGSKWVEYR
ncbi:MAG TPA: rubrerythrin family protein [Oscillospiraceae bacterium]|nr:rubrerythrin family protein [Oscillospiraceae bacterium]HPK34823.1 rubrerythrin family protein [Oscillospiraceae bacterium]HPR76783.1 rubrerythrin family protein [Oscillospiraceae bacterium]